jgi:hypothetical protein
MLPNPQSFVVHDVSCFPLVRARIDQQQVGYAPQWIDEMDLLVALGRPFVLLFESGRPEEEAHEDRRQRGLWLKKNKQALQEVCRALVSVEPDALKRTALKAQALMAVKAFGIPMDVVASTGEAEHCARERLSCAGR